MDDLSFITSGSSPDPIFFEKGRDLMISDLAARSAPGTGLLQRLRDSHQRVARLLAEGLPNTQVAAMTGYSEIRISLLKSDPAFAELVEFHRAKVAESFDAVLDRVKMLGLDALAELQDRLTDGAENFTNSELMKLVGLSLDRTGYGPTRKIELGTGGLTTEQIEKLKAAAGKENLRNAQTIDAEWREMPRAAESGGDVRGPGLPVPVARDEGARESVREEGGEGAAEDAEDRGRKVA